MSLCAGEAKCCNLVRHQGAGAPVAPYSSCVTGLHQYLPPSRQSQRTDEIKSTTRLCTRAEYTRV